mmetsp:Transcript_6822/g.12006  ORF Transcript_6822/g.12006 Transcript_6822/m.12006 type:complete len:462 (-) Transcript_6822:123-1508(-)
MASVVKIWRGSETVRLPVEGELSFASLSGWIARSWPDAAVDQAVYKDKAGVLQPITLTDFQTFLESAEVSSAGKRIWRIELRLPEVTAEGDAKSNPEESTPEDSHVDECLTSEDTPDEHREVLPMERQRQADTNVEDEATLRTEAVQEEPEEARDSTASPAGPAGADEAQHPGPAMSLDSPLQGLRSAVRRIATVELPTWQETKEELGTRLNLDSWRRRSATCMSHPANNSQEVVPQMFVDIVTTFDANQDGFLNFEECLQLQRSMFSRGLHTDTYHAFCYRFGLQPSSGLSAAALANILLCGGPNPSGDAPQVDSPLRDIEAAREEALHDLIWMFDSNEDGCLNFEDCKAVQATLFEGKLWEATYKDLCDRLLVDPEIGFGLQALGSILVSDQCHLLPGVSTPTIFTRDFVRANGDKEDPKVNDNNDAGVGSTVQGLAEQVLRVPGVIGAAARTMRFSSP